MKGSDGPSTKFLDWLLKNDNGNIAYYQLKMMAEDRIRWHQ